MRVRANDGVLVDDAVGADVRALPQHRPRVDDGVLVHVDTLFEVGDVVDDGEVADGGPVGRVGDHGGRGDGGGDAGLPRGAHACEWEGEGLMVSGGVARGCEILLRHGDGTAGGGGCSRGGEVPVGDAG